MSNTITIRGHELEIPPGSKSLEIKDGELFLDLPNDSWCSSSQEDALPIIAAVAYAEWALEALRLREEAKQTAAKEFYESHFVNLIHATKRQCAWLSLLKELKK
jgi:hypothetical protein